jgi:hypothetical protein
MASELRWEWLVRSAAGKVLAHVDTESEAAAWQFGGNTIERLALLTPESKAVIEAAEYVCDDYDEAEVNSLPTPMRHLWNAVTALHAAKAGGASDGR